MPTDSGPILGHVFGPLSGRNLTASVYEVRGPTTYQRIAPYHAWNCTGLIAKWRAYGSRCKRSRTAFASQSRCWEYWSVYELTHRTPRSRRSAPHIFVELLVPAAS